MDARVYLETASRLALGQASAEQTARLFYGDPSPADVRRLSMHERYGTWYRGSVLETHFPECRAQVLAQRGASVWNLVVTDYFRVLPPRRLPMHENAACFPAFLASRAGAVGLPAWVAEVAELEWLEWIVTSCPDDSGENDARTLCVTPTLQERVFRHDILGWLDGTGGGDGPARDTTRVVVWRDRGFVAQRACLGVLDLAILAALRRGVGAADLARQLGRSSTEVRPIVAELRAIGVLRGELPLASAPPGPPSA